MAIESLTYDQARAEHEWDVPERYNITADVCDKHARDKACMVHRGIDGSVREIDWGTMQDMVNRMAIKLTEAGVEKGDRVAHLMPPLPETAASFLATWKCGAIMLSMSSLYADEGIRHRLEDSEAKVLVTYDAEQAARVPDGMVEQILIVTEGDLDDGPAEFEAVDTSSEDPAQLYYTSGTTGLAKGILHAHRYLLAHEEFKYIHDIQDGERFHGVGEWAWAAGIIPLIGPWRYGAVQYVVQRDGGFDPKAQLEFLSENEVTNVFFTPTAIRSMMGVADAGKSYPQKFRIVCSAGEPLNPEAMRWFKQQFGINPLDFYGLSEGYPLVANFPFMDIREGSMGRPMPGWDIQILDEDERPVQQGEKGEICWRANSCPTYPLGYWNNPEASEETFGGEWFHTKDAAIEDEDGYYWFEGRADDVIISAGYRIGPFEVESACLEHPAVAEAAAVAWPDERRGMIVKAYITVAEGHEPSDELGKEISTFVRDKHSKYAYPRVVEFIDELPKTLTGKIRRIELRDRAKEG